MNLRSLLVLLDADPHCDSRIRLAARLAATHGSHLVGIAPTGLVELPATFDSASHCLESADTALMDLRQRATDLVDKFMARCRAVGVVSADGEVHEGEKLACLLHHAHCADLVIISQAGRDSPSHRQDQRFVEQVLLNNARPTLVVPQAGRIDAIGERVLVAWDDSRGSARATADALPLLRHAAQVHVRVWRHTGDADLNAIRERLDTVHRWLQRQDVKAQVRLEITDAAVGDAILATAAELGADLIVMGTYGHSRWTERIIGGVTRTALARSAVPLLMSH